MGFEKGMMYKIVYRDGDNVKTPRGVISDCDENFITLKFPDTSQELSINIKCIVSYRKLQNE